MLLLPLGRASSLIGRKGDDHGISPEAVRRGLFPKISWPHHENTWCTCQGGLHQPELNASSVKKCESSGKRRTILKIRIGLARKLSVTGLLVFIELFAPHILGINGTTTVFAQNLSVSGIYFGTVTDKPTSCSNFYSGPANLQIPAQAAGGFLGFLCQGNGCASDPEPLTLSFDMLSNVAFQGTLANVSSNPVIAGFINGEFTFNPDGTVDITLTSSNSHVFENTNPPITCDFTMTYNGTRQQSPLAADLSVTKVASAGSVNSGGQLTYTLTVTNNGPNPAQFVNVVDTLPPGVSLVSSNGSIFQCFTSSTGASSLTCLVDSMASGSSGTITIVVSVTAPSGSTITNTATVSSSNFDPNTSNNTASVTTTVGASSSPQVQRSVPAGGAATGSTVGGSGSVQAGYAVGNETPAKDASGAAASSSLPFGTAVFSVTQNGNVVSEAGVPASPPTTAGRIFIDYRTGVSAKSDQFNTGTINIDTGMALVNRGNAMANITFTLQDSTGSSPIVGHAGLAQGDHAALFIDQLNSLAPDFVLPSSFAAVTKFGSLDIKSDQPLSILALRLTTNQRGETLLTSTPIADLTQTPSAAPLFFPQFVDGGGYTTMVVLLNTSSLTESGSLQLFKDDGSPLVVQQVGGPSGSSFHYSIPPGGAFVFQTDGSPSVAHAGSAQVAADPGMNTPVGAGVFSFTQGGILVTQSGIPSASPTAHAHIFIDKSGGHDTGLAIANPTGSIPLTISLSAFQMDGSTPAGVSLGPVQLSGNGHTAAFAGQFISGLPSGFTGVLDISSPLPFVALTLRSLTNARGDFLLTTFPIADFTQSPVTPLVFPQIADGGGYRTEFILLSDGGAANATLSFFNDSGSPMAVGKASR